MKEKLKVGYIGLGRRGYHIIKDFLIKMPDVDITTVCDINPAAFERTLDLFRDAGRPLPKVTRDYKDITNDPTIDAVINMTGWNGHIAPAIASLKAGKYTAIEVGCAYDISECFDLLAAHEETGAPLMMLENLCYGRRELLATRMEREGLLGEVVHCTGGYCHYLNDCDLLKPLPDGTTDYNHYRISEYIYRNAEQYPTHELGPISKLLKINRGNRMVTIASHGSKARGLSDYVKTHLPEDNPYAGVTFRQSDVVDTVITCAGGETIHLTLDTTLPRPFYTRAFSVRGTKGMCVESAKDVCTYFFEGMEHGKVFNNEQEMFEKYDHPLHKRYKDEGGPIGSHDGCDWLVLRAFIDSAKRGIDTPIDTYDSILWLAIGPLSEQSLARGGAVVDIPDFTRGKWFRREPAPKSIYSLDELVTDDDTPIVVKS